MDFSQFIGTFVLGKVFFPVYKKAAERMCQECEPFIAKGSKILDLGCGRGTTTLTFKNYFQAEVIGTDIKDQRIFDFPFKLIDGEKLPFSDNSFDVVMINYVLHHTEDPQDLIKEAKRVSKDTIIVYEDLKEKGLTNITLWLHKNTYRILAPFQRNPIHFRNEEEWENLFNQFKLKIISKQRATPKMSWFYPVKSVLFALKK